MNQWLEDISIQTFDKDQGEEAMKYLRKAGPWGIQRLRFLLKEPFYGLNGNERHTIEG